MTIKIEFTQKPKFALGAKLGVSAKKFSDNGGFSDEALTVTVRPSAKAKAEKADLTIGKSLFSQLTDELKGITSRLTDLNESLSHAAEGSAQYEALKKEKESVESEYKRVTSGDDQHSPLNTIIHYLDSIGTILSSNGTPNGSSGNQLLGNDGVNFLTRAGASGVAELANSLRSLTGAQIEDSASLQQVTDTLDRVSNLFSGDVRADGGGEDQRITVERSKRDRPIQLEETSFGGAGQMALGLRTAAPEDLIRAASSGLDPELVNQLVLKPAESEEDERRKNEIGHDAEEEMLQLAGGAP